MLNFLDFASKKIKMARLQTIASIKMTREENFTKPFAAEVSPFPRAEGTNRKIDAQLDSGRTQRGNCCNEIRIAGQI